MQMSQTIPSGANWRQQIQGKLLLTCSTHVLLKDCFYVQTNGVTLKHSWTVSVWYKECFDPSAPNTLTFISFYCSSHHQFYLGNQVHMNVLFYVCPLVPYKCPFSFAMSALQLTLPRSLADVYRLELRSRSKDLCSSYLINNYYWL